MSEDPLLVCIVTPGHLSSAPRALKEADALLAAGYRVHVVSGSHYAPVEPLDREVLAQAGWQSTRVPMHRGAGRVARSLLRQLARRLIRQSPFATVTMAARAQHAEVARLTEAAATVPAELYLGHSLAGLAAAAAAAQRHDVRLGFDAEDFHEAETEDATAADRMPARILQGRLLPRCTHFTAASPLIAEACAKHYGATPHVVLNVFPRSQAPVAPVAAAAPTAERPARLYWFSQTIGPGRGLEAAVAIVARMKTPAELHLRGFPAAGYVDKLMRHATGLGAADRIRMLKPAPAGEMARLASEHDLGLSVEEPRPLNRALCLTNKVFTYLLAGIPQLLSRTPAQASLAPELNDAALLCDLENPAAAAQAVDEFFAAPDRIQRARRHAWDLAQTRFFWDIEKDKFLASIARALRSRRP